MSDQWKSLECSDATRKVAGANHAQCHYVLSCECQCHDFYKQLEEA